MPNDLREQLEKATEDSLLWRLDEQPEWRSQICDELGRRRSRAAVPHLLGLLKAKDYRIREAAVEALGDIGDASPVVGNALTKLVADPKEPAGVRDTAAFALGSLHYAAAVPQLIDALAAPEVSVRRCAVAALVTIGDRSAASSLRLNAEAEVVPLVRDEMRRAARLLGEPTGLVGFAAALSLVMHGIAWATIERPRFSSPSVAVAAHPLSQKRHMWVTIGRTMDQHHLANVAPSSAQYLTVFGSLLFVGENHAE